MEVYSHAYSYGVGLNWSLLTLWESSLSLNKEAREVPAIVNDVLLRRLQNKTGFCLPEEKNKMTMVRLSQNQSMIMHIPNHKVQLKAQKLRFSSDEHPNPASSEEGQLLIVAWGGLAGVLVTTVEDNDLLIICGGYEYNGYEGNKILALNLNQISSQIIRIAQCPAMENSQQKMAICLAEIIEPRFGEDVFTFEYFAVRGPSNCRNVFAKRTRRFASDEFCLNIIDTLPFSKVRGNFPMPIARGMDPHEICDLLCSSAIKLPRKSTSPPPSRQSNLDGFSTPLMHVGNTGTGDDVGSPFHRGETGRDSSQPANTQRRPPPNHFNMNRGTYLRRRWARFYYDNVDLSFRNLWEKLPSRLFRRLFISMLRGLAILLFILATMIILYFGYSIISASWYTGERDEFGTCPVRLSSAGQIAAPVPPLPEMIDDGINDGPRETPPEPNKQHDVCECPCDNLPKNENYAWLNEKWKSLKIVVISAITWLDETCGLKGALRYFEIPI